MANDKVEFDILVNGKKATKSINEVESAQKDLDKTVDKTSKNIKTNWTAIGAAAAAATVALGAMMKQSIELERSLFGLTEQTKEYVKAASEQYGMSQNLIAGFVQTGKAAGMAGSDIQVMIDQAIALGRAYPHESTESFIDNLVMLNRTGEAQGYVVDILEQKYGLIDLKTLSLAQKQEALLEATRGVNAEFDKTSAADYDKRMQELLNTSSDLGDSLMTLAEESGVLWVLNKLMEAGATAALGYSMGLNRILAGAKGLMNIDTTNLDEAFDKLVKLSEARTGDLFGTTEDGAIDLGTIDIVGGAANIIPAASPEADKGRAIALAANARFWDEYNRTMLTAQEYELGLLNDKYTEYAKHVTDKVALDEWYASEQARIMEETSVMAQHYADMQFSVTDNLTAAMMEFAETGKANFSDMANSIIQDLVRIQIQASMSNLLGSSLGGGSGIFGLLGGLFAKGDAFSNGNITPFANGGVVSSPTLFPMANGAGLMGEAGAEAIMPLTRTSGGDLGVKMEGGGTNVNVNVQNYGNDEVKVEQNGNDINVIISQIASSIQRGTGDIGTAIEGRYGVRKV